MYFMLTDAFVSLRKSSHIDNSQKTCMMIDNNIAQGRSSDLPSTLELMVDEGSCSKSSIKLSEFDTGLNVTPLMDHLGCLTSHWNVPV